MVPWPDQNSAEHGFFQPGMHFRLVKRYIHLGTCGLAFVPDPCAFFFSLFTFQLRYAAVESRVGGLNGRDATCEGAAHCFFSETLSLVNFCSHTIGMMQCGVHNK